MALAGPSLSRALRSLAAPFLFLILLIATAAPAPVLAQSSVRLPSDAVNNVGAPVDTSDGTATDAPLGHVSDADIWRYLKNGSAGAPATETTPAPHVAGRQESLLDTFLGAIDAPPTEVLSTTARTSTIQVLGEEWRLIRLDYILNYTPWILLAVLCVIVLFYLVRGKIRIRGGRSGKTIPRFSMSHRIAHWFLASSFILMGISGLIILLGRPLLVPIIGHEANSVLTSASLQGHNLFGPVFILSLLIVIFRFMKGNFFQLADFMWIVKGGGLIGGHASSNHYNFGEKTWYWIVVIVGLVMSATGLFLLFPWVTDVLAWHQLSTVLHAGGAVLMISVALGHAYIGTIGMEGSIDSMLKGEVDENWAKEHHDLWYEEVTGKKVEPHGDDGAKPAGKEQTA